MAQPLISDPDSLFRKLGRMHRCDDVHGVCYDFGVGVPMTSTLLVSSSICSPVASGNVTSETCIMTTRMSTQVIEGEAIPRNFP